MTAPALRRVLFATAFVLLATANSAGYRYAASDQAFYIPAVLRHLDPALFPADAPLIDSQARLTVVDEAIAAAVRLTHVSLPVLFLGLYVATLCLLLAGSMRLGEHLLSSRWSRVALAAALTLRHAIAKTGANTLEGYFHPRELAFALGVWATALWVERRGAWCVALLVAAAAVHSTTALWFAVLIGGAELARRRRSIRTRTVVTIAIVVVAAGVAGTTIGPLAGRLGRMDAAWLAVIAQKDYLFPLGWPADAWVTNLLPAFVIVVCWRARARRQQTFEGEAALVAGALTLVAVFFVWLPFDATHVALAVQLQVGRLFWVLDFLGTIYVVWALTEAGGLTPNVHTSPRNGDRPQFYHRRAQMGSDPAARGGLARPKAVALVLIACAVARGVYSQVVQFPDRPLFAVRIASADWRDAMTWAQSTPADSSWLADPMHAARYGSSLRAAGRRDVFIEQIKDSAIAMYDRNIAMRVADREQALAEHPWDTADGAQALARAYGIDYLVIDRALPLAEAHRSGSLYIYRLR
jgi:hypothetical protein